LLDKKLFHLSSHILHTIFWTNLTNKKSGPSGALLRQSEKDFGSYDKLKLLISKTSKGLDEMDGEFSVISPTPQKLSVLQCENHEKADTMDLITESGEDREVGHNHP
jgi:Fe-Mn family superoxide dismutase